MKKSLILPELLTRLLFLLNDNIPIVAYKKLLDSLIFCIKNENPLQFFILYDELNFTYKIVFIEKDEQYKFKEINDFNFFNFNSEITTKYDLYYEIFSNQHFFDESMSSKIIISFLFKIMISDISSFNYSDFAKYGERFINIVERRRVFDN